MKRLTRIALILRRARCSVIAALLGTFGLLLSSPLYGALISYDGADYPANSGLNNQNGGVGWFDAWYGASTAAAEGLHFPGLVTTANRILTAGYDLPTFRTPNPTGFEALLTGGYFGVDGSELWLSCLVRREATFINTEHAGLSLFNGNTEVLLVGLPAGANHWSVQFFEPANISEAADTSLATGETTLLVLRLRFGVGGAQDRVDLFVDPEPGVTPITPDATGLAANILFDRIGIQSGPIRSLAPLSVDEIRLGQTYEDVTPSVHGAAVGWLRSGAQRVTAGAELTLPLHYGWPDGDATSLTLAVTAADGSLLPVDHIVMTGTGSNRRVTFRPPAGGGGTTAITASVISPTGTTNRASFDLMIGATPPAGLLAYEPFDYSPDEYLSPHSGGQGFADSWSASLPGAVGSEFITGRSSLDYPGLSTRGGQAHTPGTFPQADKRALALPFGEDGTVRYVSLVVRPDGDSSLTSFGLRLLGGAGQDLFAGKPKGGSTLNYVLEDVDGVHQVATSKAVVQGEVSLLVLKLEFLPGPDRISLFVNPPLVTEPLTADAVKEDFDLGLGLGLALYGSTAWSADELRIGTTFASVTPRAVDFELRPLLSGDAVEHSQITRQIETIQPLPAGRTLTFELVGDSFGAAINPATGEFTWVPGELEAGHHRVFAVRATSNSTPPGIAETSFYLDVQEGNLPPQLEAIGDHEVIAGSTLTYQLVATDPDIPAQQLSYQVLDGPEGLSISSSGLLTWSPTAAFAGRLVSVTVLVADGAAGRADRSFTITVRARQPFFARWVGTISGDWNNPTNWDIGRVPNNTATEEYLVVWDAHPVTIRVARDVTVRSFSFLIGGTLDLQTPNFVVDDKLLWNAGTIGGNGALTVHGRAEMSTSTALSLEDQSQLVLGDFSELDCPLQFNGTTRLVIQPTATLGVAEGGEFRRVAGTPEIDNHGAIRIWNSAPSVSLIQLRNYGTITPFSHTLDLLADPSGTGIYQEGGGSFEVGGGIDSPATINGSILVKEGSRLFGEANIFGAQIEGVVQGRMHFERLSFGPTAVLKYEIAGPQDVESPVHPLSFLVDGTVALDGRLELSLRSGFTPGPDDQFLVLRADGGITGEFLGTPFGQRIQLPFGTGSFLLTRSPDNIAIRLSRFLPPAIGLESAPLTFRLPETAGQAGGCFVIPHPAINLPPGSWAGGRLDLEVISFDSASEVLAFQTNPAFGATENISFEGPAEGLTVKYHGSTFGVTRIVGGHMTCLLNAAAQNEAIVALLGSLYYGNRELTPDWFTEPERHYPARNIDITLTDAGGMESHVRREVLFPFLLGIQLGEPLPLSVGASSVLQLQGLFSNDQVLPVRHLQTMWTEGCGSGTTGGVLGGPVAGFPGEWNVRRNDDGAYCCTVYASAGFLQTRMEVYDGSLVRAVISFLRYFFDTDDSVPGYVDKCPVRLSFYVVPDECALTTTNQPANRRIKALTQPSTPSPTPFYALEALMKTTAAGQRLVDIYRQHGPEVVRIFLSHLSVMAKSWALITAFSPGVTALLAGGGDEVMITPLMIDLVNSIWNELAGYASPALKAALDEEQTRFDSFERFRDVSFAQWAGLLGITVPTRPLLHISLTRREAGRFYLAANDVPGTDVVLWRSADLKVWEQVRNADVQRDGVTLVFTDPAPPVSEAFYTIRAQ